MTFTPLETKEPMPMPAGNELAIVPVEPEPEAIALNPTSLKLTDTQLDNLVNLALERMSEVMIEMGRNWDGSVVPGSWMDERDRNQKSYDKDLRWREAIPGSVFRKSNLTWGDNCRRVKTLSDRVRNDLMGTSPFFQCMTKRNGDPDLTKQVEDYIQDRLENTDVTDAIREGIRVAMIRNEAVMKTTYLVDKTPYVGPAKGVFVGADGLPIRTPTTGEYVFKDDDVIPDPNVQGGWLLKKDPSFDFSQGPYEIQDFDALPQQLTRYEGATTDGIDFRDFLCPLKDKDIHTADICVHLYEKSPEWVYGTFGDLDSSDRYFTRRGGRSGALQPIRVRGEDEEKQSQARPRVLIAEVYIRCDADGDGIEEEIMMVLDLDNSRKGGEAIFYDYLANHMKERPFVVIPGLERVAGRWYGLGIFSKMFHPELFADLQLNRMNDKCSRSNTLRWLNKDSLIEVKNREQLVFGSEFVYTRNPGSDPSIPPVGQVNLMENLEIDMALTSQMRSAADTEFQISTNQSASSVKENRSNTAFGLRSIQQDTDIATGDTEYEIACSIERILGQAIQMELDHMNPTVVAVSADGKLATLNREEIRSLDRSVRLLLTRRRAVENSQAEAICIRYFQLTPVQQNHLRDLYLAQLRDLQIDDADKMLPVVTDEEAAAWLKAQQDAQNQQQQKPVSESIAIKLQDLAYSERVQALAKAGIQAAPPGEIAAMQVNKVNTKIAEKTQPPDAQPSVQSVPKQSQP